jgi:hypothetical protein
LVVMIYQLVKDTSKKKTDNGQEEL